MVGDCLVRYGGISLIVTVEVGSMPITLSWHATMSTDRLPHFNHLANYHGRSYHWSRGLFLYWSWWGLEQLASQ